MHRDRTAWRGYAEKPKRRRTQRVPDYRRETTTYRARVFGVPISLRIRVSIDIALDNATTGVYNFPPFFSARVFRRILLIQACCSVLKNTISYSDS
jgi:hypothetical protein